MSCVCVWHVLVCTGQWACMCAFTHEYLIYHKLEQLCNSVVGLTDLGTFLIEDLHEVNHNVSEQTKSAMLYLAATPLLEAIVSTKLAKLIVVCSPDMFIRHASLLIYNYYSSFFWLPNVSVIAIPISDTSYYMNCIISSTVITVRIAENMWNK